ncbi:MAG: hypothetical protein QW757_06060 [Candidatus Woesearchaeota archaeon]
MNKYLYFFTYLFIITNLSGFNILNFSYGSKSVGLGESLCSLPEEIENIYYNPAGLVGVNPFEFKFMYFNWVGDINIGDFVLAKSFKDKFTLGMSFNYIWTQLESESVNSVYYSVINNLAYARKISKTYFGVGVTTLYEKISTEENSNIAAGLNLGLLLKFQMFSFGACIRNLGQSFDTMGSELVVLPTSLNFGTSYISSNHTVLLSNVRYNLDGLLSVHTGVELPLYIGIRENISIRIGNVLNLTKRSELPLISNFRFGLGFRKEGLKLDYSLVPLGEIGLFHYISLGFMFY